MDKKPLQQPLTEQRLPQPEEKNKNGSMAQNFEEVKKLGKEMNNMKTGSQHLEDDNLISDPRQ